MKQIAVNLYRFEELPPQVKEKVLEKHRHINVEDSWWYDEVFDDFCNLCSTIGIVVERDKIHFRGFYSQGDGSSFSASVDVLELLRGVSEQKWKAYAPDDKIRLEPCYIHSLVYSLLERGQIEASIQIGNSLKGYFLNIDTDFYYSNGRCNAYPQIELELSRLENWFKRTADALNRHLFKSLERQYDYQCSDEAVTDTLVNNHYLFTEDGRSADYLEMLATSKTKEDETTE